MKLFWLLIAIAAFNLGLAMYFAYIGGRASAIGMIIAGAFAVWLAFRSRRSEV